MREFNEIRNLLPTCIAISDACAKAGIKLPTLQFSEESGRRLEEMILSDRLLWDQNFPDTELKFFMLWYSF